MAAPSYPETDSDELADDHRLATGDRHHAYVLRDRPNDEGLVEAYCADCPWSAWGLP